MPLLKSGIVLIDPASARITRVIAFQYNPETLTRQLQVQGVGENGDRSEALRLKAPPVETLRLEAILDATDQLEFPDQHPAVAEVGLGAQIAALEILLYPPLSRIRSNHDLASSGTLEILPIQSDLSLFVWSPRRIVPVRITELSVTEESFDHNLNPLRAKVSLGLRVLSIHDLGFDHKGGSLYLASQEQKERLAAMLPDGSLSAFGLTRLP